jgi:hypothetical protein
MATAAANPVLQFIENGVPLDGGTIYFYESGSSTPKTAYGDANESTSFTSIGLDSNGSAIVYFGSGSYKLVVKRSDGTLFDTIDPVNGAITSVAASSEWISSGDTPTYISSTSFSVPGDRTASYDVGRRVKTINTAGTTYSVITASSYSAPNTTITVENQSGTLDSGLGSVDLGLITATNTSLPRLHEGSMRVIGCNCANNSSTPDTQFDMDADAIVLRNSKNQTVTVWNPGTLTNDISTAGPAANGRDQSGAFSNSSWVHFYWIWNGTTLATLSSATAPPTGPTLPSGYTHWAYAGADYLGSGGALRRVYIKGSTVSYAASVQVLNTTAQAASPTAINLGAVVPPNAGNVDFSQAISIAANSNGSAAITAAYQLISGTDYLTLRAHSSIASGSGFNYSGFSFPNVGQNIYYKLVDDNANTLNRSLIAYVRSYTVPNGG